jgi:hypothetical protein
MWFDAAGCCTLAETINATPTAYIKAQTDRHRQDNESTILKLLDRDNPKNRDCAVVGRS